MGLLCLLSACGGGPVQADPPSPHGKKAKVCRNLYAKLPHAVDGHQRRKTEPRSSYTAAWGDPAVVLTCGVRKPAVLRPHSGKYDPRTDASAVNGVDWLFEEESDGYRFTTVNRGTNVRVTVPNAYSPEVNPLLDLASVVKRTVPNKF